MRLFSLLLFLPMVLSCQLKPGRCGNEVLLLKPFGDSLPVFQLAAGMPALDGFLDSMLALQMNDPENVMRFYLRDSANSTAIPVKIALYHDTRPLRGLGYLKGCAFSINM